MTESFKAFAFCLLTGLVFWYTIGWSASFGEYCKKLNRDPKKVLRFCACGFWGLALVFLPDHRPVPGVARGGVYPVEEIEATLKNQLLHLKGTSFIISENWPLTSGQFSLIL